MKLSTNNRILIGIAFFLFFTIQKASSQTSWTGTTSNYWNLSTNWTNGVPTSSVDAIIGDASFTGAFQPTIGTAATCKSLTIGGAVTSTLTLNYNLTVSGNVTINSNGTITHSTLVLTLSGNWTNSGVYNATGTGSKVTFNGTASSLTGATTFRKLTINKFCVLTLNANITVTGSAARLLVAGTLNPNESPTYTVTSTVTSQVNGAGTLKINTSTFAGNYILSGTTTLKNGSTFDYSSTTTDQIISSAYTYSTLKISGTGTTKSLSANLNNLVSASATLGNIYVQSGTLDIGNYTANRGTTVTGGTFSVSNGATLKMGGTNSTPTGFNTNTYSLTSTVEYNGTNQTVSPITYGNLILSSSSGAAVKTLPSSALTVVGNFTSTVGLGTSVSYTAASNIAINGVLTIGASTTFDAATFAHTFSGNLINNGTITGNTSTITLNGAVTTISGSGTNNFNNLTIAASGIATSGTVNISVSGDLTTSGAGTFNYSSGGTLSMSGTSKSIAGTDFTFNNLNVSGTIATASTLTILGDLSVGGTFTSSTGVVTLSGTAKNISGGGTLSFYSLYILGTISNTSDFTIQSTLNISGTLTATAGTVIFTGTSTFNGTADLFNITINGTSLQLSTDAILRIANVFTITSGTLDVTSTIPNTVVFNNSSAQNINGINYHNLILTNGNTKTANAGISVNGDLTIDGGTIFDASSFTHTLKGNWIKTGTFTPSSSTIEFIGSSDATITGSTTFNILTINKTNSNNKVVLANNVSVPTLNMTSGEIHTGSNKITITSTRSGNGIILGTIQRDHSFGTSSYEFEGPNNSITFVGPSAINSVTVKVTQGTISDFPFGGSINREYTITIPSGTYTSATARLHYLDAELNGNAESSMILWNYNGSNYVSSNKTANDASANYVEQSGLTNIARRWTMSDDANVIKWNGSVSNSWSNTGNWTTVQGSPNNPPGANDIVQLGTASTTYQPSISSAVTVKGIVFYDGYATTLTLAAGGSLQANGNINGVWSSSITHTINVGAQTLIVDGDLTLSDGTSGHIIDLNISTGVVTVTGSITESGGANITLSGAGTINVQSNFTYTNGTFTPSTGTVVYNGTGSQVMAGITYYNLTINKPTGIAALNTSATINGDLTVTSGTLNINAASTIVGNVSISSGATLNGDGIMVSVGGNWTNSGTFISASGTINFNGTGSQSISTTPFNTLRINKASGTATLTANVSINSNLEVLSGTLDLATFNCNRGVLGGTFTLSNGTSLLLSGSANFPANFSASSIGATSTVNYYGSGTQTVSGGITYGNLIFNNGGSNAKTMSASATIAGNFTISSGALFNASSYSLNLSGNFVNSGTFTASTSTIILNGTAKTILGATTFNAVTVNGSYTVSGSNIIYNGHLNVAASGSFDGGSGLATISGNLTNNGSLISNGTTTFSGTQLQTIRLLNAISSNSSGIINFNGSVSPVLNSTSTPTFATLNVNNTGGINPSVNWIVGVAMTVASGATFNGGSATHTIYGNFTNGGTVTSNGGITFTPSTSRTIALGSAFSSTGIVTFGGAGQITITGTPGSLNDVAITNTNASGISPTSGWTMTGDFVIGSSSIFNAGSFSYTVGGDLSSDGTLNGGTSTFTLNSTDCSLTGSSNTSLNNLTFASSSVITTINDINVAGNLTNNSATLDATIGAIVMTGTSNATISGSQTPSTLSQLIIKKTGAGSVTLAVNISTVTELTVNSGIFDASSFSISQNAGTITIEDSATIKIGGTRSFPTFNSYVIDTTSSIIYNGTTQAIPNSFSYGNLIINSSGTKTASAALKILSSFTLSTGTFVGGSFTHTIAGNWGMSSGTFTNTGTTISFNGITDQTLSSTGAFNNLTVNKSLGQLLLASNITINSSLTLTSGKIVLDSLNLTMGTSGSISGGSSSAYAVANGTGVLTQQITNSSNKVFPIGTSSDYMPATIALTAGSTTDNFRVRLSNQVKTGGDTGTVISNEAVNVTWFIEEQTVGGSDATLTFQWPASLEQAGFTRGACRLVHYSSGVWNYGSTDLSASGSDPYTLSRASITSFSPFAIGNLGALPVTWISLSGKNQGNQNKIQWATASELNNDFFTIEYSVDGIIFNEAGRIKGSGNSNQIKYYEFIHQEINSSNYFYRVKQTDFDGKFDYSNTIYLRRNSEKINTAFELYPNPFQNEISIQLNNNYVGSYKIEIFNNQGAVVKHFNINKSEDFYSQKINLLDLNYGLYYFRITNENGISETKSIIKF